MKYFKDDKNNVYAYEDDADEFILEGLIQITEKEAIAIANPPPTHDELIAAAEAEKKSRMDQANDYMNSKQWPGKAAIGRLKGDELAQYNLWLDYLDALDEVDTSIAPDIDWPEQP
ncbi:tail fiber assembly protein [Citrobacter freundii]|nr:tail fiber assembly protein [Citrobacter freundii]MDN4197182.1 tail fiber assembly protein [Citrobacter freundii]MDN4227702.1 tail fiber assembly protein [Citrobacter freundii]